MKTIVGKRRSGFTLPEILLVLGIIAIFSALTFATVLKPQFKASMEAVTLNLMADIKGQQLKAVSAKGTDVGGFGIHFETNRYILFEGVNFNPLDPNNLVINLPDNVVINNVSFPNNDLIFARRSGEVVGFLPGSNTLTVSGITSQEENIIEVNRYGALFVN